MKIVGEDPQYRPPEDRQTVGGGVKQGFGFGMGCLLLVVVLILLAILVPAMGLGCVACAQ